MTFLSPMTGILAGAVAIPLLILLYVLRLRRRTVRIASTMLWDRTAEDLEVNTPFRRLRFTPLLLLQLLAVILILLALAEPVLDDGGQTSGRTILVIDRSASMAAPASADDPSGPTRLDAALDEARSIVDARTRGRGGRDPGALMVVAFDARPEVLAAYDERPGVLRAALDTIQTVEATADLPAAIRLASAFGVTAEADASEPPELILLTDGGVVRPPTNQPIQLAGASLDIRIVGAADDASGGAAGGPSGDASGAAANAAAGESDATIPWNAGIVAASARRSDDDPVQVRLFVRVAATTAIPPDGGPESLAVRVEVDGLPVATGTPEFSEPESGRRGPAEASLSFDIDVPEAATIVVRLPGGDALVADDFAAIRMPPAARPRIVVVAPDARPVGALRALLAATDPSSLRVLTPVAWTRERDRGGAPDADLVVFDRAPDMVFPPVASLWFGCTPVGVGQVGDGPAASSLGGVGSAADAADAADGQPAASPPDPAVARRVLSWRRSHPVLRSVTLDDVAWSGFAGWREPPRAEVLARGPDGPIMLEVPAAATRHVLVGIPLNRTNWITDVGFAIFVQNSIGHLAATGAGQAGRMTVAGTPVRVRAAPDAERVEVRGPVSLNVDVIDGNATIPALPVGGVYTAAGALSPDDVLAVSLVSDVETDLRPRRELSLVARQVRTGGVGGEVPRDLWRWFALAGGVLAMLEWLIWARLARV
ncbi:MAG: BatA domain-containing protein [Phycisphaerales bacterium]